VARLDPGPGTINTLPPLPRGQENANTPESMEAVATARNLLSQVRGPDAQSQRFRVLECYALMASKDYGQVGRLGKGRGGEGSPGRDRASVWRTTATTTTTTPLPPTGPGTPQVDVALNQLLDMANQDPNNVPVLLAMATGGSPGAEAVARAD
jgi:tetratricopeptide repeat protein 21B